jgi:hypothetical protein
MVALFKDGETVVNRVRAGQAAALKTDTAQIGVGFDNTLQRIGHHSSLSRQACFSPSASSVS